MKALSLFSGAGCSSQGLEEAGYEVVGRYELNEDASDSLILNGKRGVRRFDLRYMNWRDEGYRPGDLDLVEGGPPCQPFSQAGKGKGAEDKRDCIPDFAFAIQQLMPRLFIMENVKALTFKRHAGYLSEILDWFPEEYHLEYRVLRAEEYGVPQTRERFFLVGRLDGPVAWPEPTHRRFKRGVPQSEGNADLLPWVSMAEALGWTADGVVRTGNNQATTGPGDRDAPWRERAKPYERSLDDPSPTVDCKGHKWQVMVNTGRDWKPGGTRADAQKFNASEQPAPAIDTKGRWGVELVASSMERATVRDAGEPAPTVLANAGQQGGWDWRAQERQSIEDGTWPLDRPATTVVGDPRLFAPGGHKANDGRDNTKQGNRSGNAIRVEPEEAAVLQDFPPGWVFAGNRTSVFRQIGNACPRSFTRAVALANKAA